jgi:hypothetical protein
MRSDSNSDGSRTSTSTMLCACSSRETSRGSRVSMADFCQRRSKTGPPLIVIAEVKVDHPPGLV